MGALNFLDPSYFSGAIAGSFILRNQNKCRPRTALAGSWQLVAGSFFSHVLAHYVRLTIRPAQHRVRFVVVHDLFRFGIEPERAS